MRLKQLLGILLPLVVAIATAASESHLTQVDIGKQANATTLTLRATGAFTHSEYRPTESLMLVDLAGVSAASMDDRTQSVNLPGVVSYRVVGYKSADGAEVARLELTLAPGATVGVRKNNNDLVLRVSGSATQRSQVNPIAAQPATISKKVSRSQPTTVQRVSVVRGRNGIDVEILANGLLEPKALRLSQPERVVVDLLNAVPLLRQHTITVNAAEVKTVRMSRYQSEPPVTRIVVDLGSARDFDLVPAGKKLVVKLHGATQAAQTPAPEAVKTPAVAVASAEAKPAEGKAQELVVVQPSYHQVAATGSTPAPQSAQPQSAQAQPAQPKPAGNTAAPAAKYAPASANPELALSPTSASLRPQVGNNLNFHQQVGPQAAAPASRAKYTGEPISVNLKDVDLKDFFRLIHEISGLNVVLDPNVRGTLTIVLDDVPWDQALDIVLKNNGLDRQLEGNVLRIATVETLRKEADARRAQLEAQALAVEKVTVTRFLSYAHAKDVVPTVKKFLSQRGDVVSDDRTNALIIDDIPGTIPRIDELLAKLDRKTQEVEIEARVVAATRSFARDIGTQLGFGYGNGKTAVGGVPAVGASPNNIEFTGIDPLTGQPVVVPPRYFTINDTQIPLFSNLGATGPTSGFNFSTATLGFRLDFLLTLAESRGLLKILSRPRVVTQNNIQALVRQGLRIPIVTQAQLGGPPTVTYVDAFLRLTVTPQITIEGTIFLNVDVENTVPDFGRTIQGNPTLITQQATTQVLVTDGGTVVIGGVIQTQNSVNVRQVPLLGNIPLLGNLFKSRAVSTSTQELIFFITPRIIQT